MERGGERGAGRGMRGEEHPEPGGPLEVDAPLLEERSDLVGGDAERLVAWQGFEEAPLEVLVVAQGDRAAAAELVRRWPFFEEVGEDGEGKICRAGPPVPIS